MTRVEDIENATQVELDEMAWRHRYNMNRDKLAAQAMQGLCAASGEIISECVETPQETAAALARVSYDMAEAMLAEGKKRTLGQ